MANEQPLSPFQEVHKKIQEAHERAHNERQRDDTLRRERSEKEATEKGFDRV
jgi:hypothetical protein